MSRIEAGKKGCSVDLFVQLSDIFNVSLDYLILGKADTLPSSDNKARLKKIIDELISLLDAFRKNL